MPIDDPRFGKFQRCPNNPVQDDQEMHARLRRFGNLQAYQDRSFETFQTNLHGRRYNQLALGSLRAAKSAAQAFAEKPHGWLVFEGMFGCGKTHLAVAIANWRLENYGERVLFITTPDLLDLLRSTFDDSAGTSFDSYFERIRSAQLLVLDDLGVENSSNWAQEKLFQLLNHRHVAALPTVITSNKPVADMDPRLGSRLLDRSLVKRITIQAPDYRKMSRSRAYGGAHGGARQSERFDLRLYEDMRFETFSTESAFADDARNLRRALKAAMEWTANPEGWLHFIGGYGTGKTHLAAAIAYDLHERGQEVIFMTVPNLLDFLRLSFNPRLDARFDTRFHEIVDVPFLALDDLSWASATPWAKEKLFQIIDTRYLARLPTVFTSAETLEESDERLATRLADRRVCTVFALTAPSYVMRMKKPR